MKIIGLLSLLIICTNVDNQPATYVNTTPPPITSAVGKVVAVNGTANISRNNVRLPIRVRRNLQLIRGDEVRVDNSSTVKVVCWATRSSVDLAAGQHRNICAANQAGDTFTDILNRGRIEVITRANGQVIFRPRANNYPEFLAKIINGRPEYWGSSISLKKLLPNDARNDLVNRIRALPSTVSSDERRLLLVDVYSMNKMYERAIEELNDVSNAADDPFIQINLGDLYMTQSQSGDAKRAYSAAIKTSAAASEPMAEAIAQHAFGLLLKYEKARIADARIALTRAVSLYRDLGENAVADSLQTELNELPVQPSSGP